VPLQKVTRGFKDISLSFRRHPVTDDILPLKNEDAIKRAVQNLVRTQLGEVFFNNLVGTRVQGALFELSNSGYIEPMKTEIETVINNYEPRVSLKNVNIELEDAGHSLDISIAYDIVGLSTPTQEINFVLEPTRL